MADVRNGAFRGRVSGDANVGVREHISDSQRGLRLSVITAVVEGVAT